MSIDVCDHHIADASAWTGKSLENSEEWVYHFTDSDLVSFDAALARTSDLPIYTLTAMNFALGSFLEPFKELERVLETGRGLVLLRGLPIYERYTEGEAMRIYWMIARQLGNIISQNSRGQLIGLLRSEVSASSTLRNYNTSAALPFHSDRPDFVGLLCLRPATKGGESLVSSLIEMHNVTLTERPDYLPVLYNSYAVDWKGDNPVGTDPWYFQPTYSYTEGVLSGLLVIERMKDAMRFPEVHRLAPEEIEALDFLQQLPERPGMALRMSLQTGDIQLLANHVVCHSRTAFEDDPEDPSHRRSLLRLWVANTRTGRPVHPQFAAWRVGIPSPTPDDTI